MILQPGGNDRRKGEGSDTGQNLAEILAPNGVPIGRIAGGAEPTIRTLPGGEEAARLA